MGVVPSHRQGTHSCGAFLNAALGCNLKILVKWFFIMKAV